MERRNGITIGHVVLLLLTGMSIVGALSVCLFARAMLYLLGETSFPSVVSESFWICIWLMVAEASVVVAVAVAFWLQGVCSKKHKVKEHEN